MQVVAQVNQQLQELVAKVLQVSAAGDSSSMSQLTNLRTSISKLAAVQQDALVDSVSDLAESLADKFASNPAYDATVELADLSDVSVHVGCCVTDHDDAS